jgi:hypothetical protein
VRVGSTLRPMIDRSFLRLGSVCALLYALVTVGVNVSRAIHPDPSALRQAVLDPTVQAREWVLFWALFILFGTWLALAEHLSRGQGRPWARAGLVFTALFCAVELTHRSVLLVAAPVVARRSIGSGLEAFGATTWLLGLEHTVAGLYVVLIAAHGLGSAAFAISAAGGGPERLIRWALGANAVRLALRFLEFPVGLRALEAVNAAIYAPAVTLIFAAVGVALWQSGRSVRPLSVLGSAPR